MSDQFAADIRHVEDVWRDKLTKLNGLVANIKPGVDLSVEFNQLKQD